MSKSKAPPNIVKFPIAKLLGILEEMSHLEGLGRSLLKWYVTETELDNWEGGPIPLLIDTLGSAGKVKDFINEKITNPTPEEQLIAASMGFDDDTLPFAEAEVMMISSALTLLDQNKAMLKMKHNVSFEVH